MPRCPKCVTVLNAVEDGGIMCAVCPGCEGTWISAKALDRRMKLPDAPDVDTDRTALADLAAAVSTSNAHSELRCGDCHAVMTRERFHPMIPVEIDRCPRCDYLWLDAGERPMLLRLYHELMHSTDPEIAAKRGKLDRLAEIQSAPPEGFEELDQAADVLRAAGRMAEASATLASAGRRQSGVETLIWAVLQFVR